MSYMKQVCLNTQTNLMLFINTNNDTYFSEQWDSIQDTTVAQPE